MDSAYDRKFEEMKKYVPFLENMIKRLETTSSGSNPRQAQLDKIRSLRDLLLDKKKRRSKKLSNFNSSMAQSVIPYDSDIERMKMENLLKCEQVLINLYAKVEQRDTLPGLTKDNSSNNDKTDLNVVRGKLKSVVSKLNQEPVETLPEIARASQIEEVCVPGSKEPALFQRRPNIPSTSLPLSRLSPSRSKESLMSKKSYTRVLASPEPSEKHWPSDVSSLERQLFSRRSPKNSPRKRSPNYHKKERKKSSKNKAKYSLSKDLNITLKVPEDSLNSLNTKDILSRIINCSDNDVDITTLRELRTQILGELKETGTNDDISDIILKSYKKSSKTNKNKKEVEEGELSDSESEAIESIYGSLVVMDKTKHTSEGSKSLEKEKARKIQICLVINSDKSKTVMTDDFSDFESFHNDDNKKPSDESEVDRPANDCNVKDHNNSISQLESKQVENNDKASTSKLEQKSEEILMSPQKTEEKQNEENKTFSKLSDVESNRTIEVLNQDPIEGRQVDELRLDTSQKKNIPHNLDRDETANSNVKEDIPLLEPTKQVSEIDILQALKKEILCETTNVLNTDTTESISTPLLHQPKVTKVANAQEIGAKKRISIESYKAKSTPSTYKLSDKTTKNIKDDVSRKQSLKLTEKECERFNFLSKIPITESSDDEDASSLSLDDIYTDLAPKSPDHEDFADTGLKPPIIIPSDPVQTAIVSSEADVDMRKLLPNVKSVDSCSAPTPSPVTAENKPIEKVSPLLLDPRTKRDVNSGLSQDDCNIRLVNFENSQRPIKSIVTTNTLMPSVKVDLTPAYNQDNSNQHINIPSTYTSNMNIPTNITQGPPSNIPCPLLANMTPIRSQNSMPSMPPNMSPNIPILMTPSRNVNVASMTPSRMTNMIPNMTPSRHPFENEDTSNHKHVYAPVFPPFEPRDNMDNIRENHQNQWDTSDGCSPYWEDRSPRNTLRDIDYRESRNLSNDIDYRENPITGNPVQRDVDYRSLRGQSVQRDVDYRDLRNNSAQSGQNFDPFSTSSPHAFRRIECPPTPTPSFGRPDMPMTPVHPFGRSDCPLTPSHPFGRAESINTFNKLDCPLTPSHPFGRGDPINSFNKADCPLTPSHPFGRGEPINPFNKSDCPLTPSHPFGRGDPINPFNKADCPLTPSHPFGRSEHGHSFNKSDCPLTPSHPFGRGEPVNPFNRPECPLTPSHPFGRGESLPEPHSFMRNDYNNQTPSRSQDPRLNRNSDYEGNQYRDDDRERNQRTYQDRNFSSYNAEQSNRHNNSDFFRKHQREQSVGRKERSKIYEPTNRNFREQMSRRETSVGRVFNREYETDKYSRNRSRYEHRNNTDSNNYDDSSRRNYRRERSSSMAPDSFSNSPNDRTKFSKFSQQNSFCVKQHGGQSFTIDTSVDSSFQRQNEQESVSSFNDRRQRASSVGRSLVSHKSTALYEAKPLLHEDKKLRNIKNFRRACSVGREIEDNTRAFKEIKDDLKSFKFKSDYKFPKNRNTHEAPESEHTKIGHRHGGGMTEELYDKLSNSSKYSPRKNNRDPRVRREHDVKDNNYKSRDSKTHGIVYSSDNISKGAFLGSGYGVKNYKIPKIRRPQEIIPVIPDKNDTEFIQKDIDIQKQYSKTMKQESEALISKNQNEKDSNNSKNTDLRQENEALISKNQNEKDSNNSKNTDVEESQNITLTQQKNEAKDNEVKNRNIDNCLIEKNNFAMESAPIEKTLVLSETRKPKKTQLQKTKDTHNDDSKNKKTEIERDTTITLSENLLDKVEKRITRSSSKSMTEESPSLELSPVKRMRRNKKAFIIESDSEDSDKKSVTKNSLGENMQIDLNQPLSSINKLGFLEKKSSIGEKKMDVTCYLNEEKVSQHTPNKEDFSVVLKGNEQVKTSEENNEVADSISGGQVLVPMALHVKNEEEVDTEIKLSDNLKTVEQNLAPTELDEDNHKLTHEENEGLKNTNNEEQKISSTKNEEITLQCKNKVIEDDLDSSFGIAELEMFSDAITSDPVIDNINALIADLDHDLDSSKNADNNSHFTKELNLETMLENITSPENCDSKKEHNCSEATLQNVIEKSEDISVSVMSQDKAKNNFGQDMANAILNISCSNDQEPQNLLTSENEISKFHYGSLTNETITDEIQIKLNSKDMDKDADVNDGKLSKAHSSKNILNEQQQHDEVNKNELEDTCSNEAIVSTSEDGGNTYKADITLKNVKDNESANISFTPDSTINNNEILEDVERKSTYPVTIESSCEMNSDITSTHITDITCKDSLEVPSADTGTTSTEIESIGKLLSILQDKSKIKELLSLLGNPTSENEKIKKKLEKLSEIVSDDESNSDDKYVDNLEITNSNENNSNKKTSSELKECDINQSVPPKVIQAETESNSEINNCGTSMHVEHKTVDNEINCGESCITEKCHTEESIFNKNENKTHSKNEDNVGTGDINTENIIPHNVDGVIDNINDFNLNSDDNKFSDNNIPESLNKEDISQVNVTVECEKPVTKKTIKKKASKKGKKRNTNKKAIAEDKRLTRSDLSNLQQEEQQMTHVEKPIQKKPNRELKKLQEDIREMFLKDDILNASGIRMCRIAKLVDDKKPKEDALSNESSNHGPLVVLKKCNDIVTAAKEKNLRKAVPKNKTKISSSNNSIDTINREGNINKFRSKQGNVDPYDFDTDSLNEKDNANANNKHETSSECESDSVESTKSFESAELVGKKKKAKRKRSKGWKAGIIKPKNRKKKPDPKAVVSTDDSHVAQTSTALDLACFTDKDYCFRKLISNYDCRFCIYNGSDIVHHYKKEHPHIGVPLSRLSAQEAMFAIKESRDENFLSAIQVSSKKYVCRFCFKEFGRKNRLLETFFWHIVTKHTGEYNESCSKCTDTQSCPLNIDIPSPPKDAKGQITGYICEKCHYTQLSLDNLKTHLIVRHNDELSTVFKINLSQSSKTGGSCISNTYDGASDIDQPRTLRSSRSNQTMAEASDDESDGTEEINVEPPKSSTDDKMCSKRNIKSKLTFEGDNLDEIHNFEINVKIESQANNLSECDSDIFQPLDTQIEETEKNLNNDKEIEPINPKDIIDYPHFKIKCSESGSNEYVCCINGVDRHYKTTLLISFKKHVQLKHTERWDGYCYICKVIVTPQGYHKFKDCLQHFLDKHIDNFPTLEEETKPQESKETTAPDTVEEVQINKSYINVRPLSELVSTQSETKTVESSAALPVIESVVSLGTHIEQSKPSPSYPSPITKNVETFTQYRYEEFQAEIMSKKHRVVLEAMMTELKLVQVFKCAGRFCSFTTDSAEDALLHASTHMRIGGVDSLNCAYCDYDSCSNAIDLITHVFKYHGCCTYVCGMCFYRATASQLVNAHIKRLHDKSTNVPILKTSFQAAPIIEEGMLPRETAVSFYLCCDKSSPDGPCKFRTYTPGKFSEHLNARHPTATEYICFICASSKPTPADLITHLKVHGLKLYQCTWCVFGADTEFELLQHASALHPARYPKAYLRIITNKEGSSELRVLPLAHLNKSNVLSTDVVPKNLNLFPVREAERSMELEKLIGHTTQMIESMATSTETGTQETETNVPLEPVSQLRESLLQSINIFDSADPIIPRVTTPTPLLPSDLSSSQSTPIIKTETLDLTPEKIPQPEPEVVCLDSDDESADMNVSNVPVNSNPAPNLEDKTPEEIVVKKVPVTQLFSCSKCKMIFKYGSGFRKHINACFNYTNNRIPCAHCSVLLCKKDIVAHYNSHVDKSYRYFCEKCSMGFNTIAQVNQHQLTVHTVATSESLASSMKEIVKPGPKGRRKRSLEMRDKAVEPPEKRYRYGPADIDKLPINPILDDYVVCSLCEFNTKVRLNMVRHLQLHAQQQPVPQTAPVNPVPHLETNEKHFDRMVNLASSSISTRQTDKSNNKSDPSTSTAIIPPEAVARYPKYVKDKHRLTCGAKGCSYISVDESMLKCHWETLHSGSNDFHCVHCPPYQSLDKSKPLTAARIIAHLKMHDAKLYACSTCSYYHYRRTVLEKHLSEFHGNAQVLIVREGKVNETPTPVPISHSKTAAPTMDLKPWQCGLCKFKSLLRPEVVEHCAKVHHSKMQFKCFYCAFKASNAENVTKHQAKSHIGRPEEIFYFYYREGSVPDEPDGATRWQKQTQNVTSLPEPTVKTENLSDTASLPQKPPVKTVSTVDLNLVKKETIEPVPESIEDLCKEFGMFCDPNGLKYKCCLCNNVIEDSLEVMQSHLYEELKYRKWGCSICSYKAFHKEGLSEHMQTEHRQNRDPIALPADNRVETWVAKLLEHQTVLIKRYKENLAKQKVEILRVTAGPSTQKLVKDSPIDQFISKINPNVNKEIESNPHTNKEIPNTSELEKLFGPFGTPQNLSYSCPKCSSEFKEEDSMQSHLESELSKIRWVCSNCSLHFQTYHAAQFHCRSVHVAQGSRPVEVTRDPSIRQAWIQSVIRAQKSTMDIASPPKNAPANLPMNVPESSDNSLLVIRYEEKIPTPEEEMRNQTPPVYDSDDEKLVIDEPLEQRKTKATKKCPYCTITAANEKVLKDHILRHYNLKAFMCPYCDITGSKKAIIKHQKLSHVTHPINLINTPVPELPPSEYANKKMDVVTSDSEKLVCLVCRSYVVECDVKTHVHDKILTTFGKKGEVVVQCSACYSFHKDVTAYLTHHKAMHSDVGINYVFSKLNINSEYKGLLYACGNCPQKFSQMKDLKVHVDESHQSLLKYTLVPKYNIPTIDLDQYELETNKQDRSSSQMTGGTAEVEPEVTPQKRKNEDDSILPSCKRTARKSTTKLPDYKSFAKKSTSKLPFTIPIESEYSYYGTKPVDYSNSSVYTMMPFCNKMTAFPLKQLKEIINMNPVVLTEKMIIDDTFIQS